MKYFDLNETEMEPFRLQALKELYKNTYNLRKGERPLSVREKDVILIDDVVITGATMEVVIQLMKKKHVRKIIVATPLIPQHIAIKLESKIDNVVSVISPQLINSLGEWYEDYTKIENEEFLNNRSGLSGI
jgi:putative phosphoribosyl transferase